MHRSPVKYLIVIDSGGSMVARLFDADRVQVAEMDASTEEVGATTAGITPTSSGMNPAWDLALAGHSAVERAGAEVYTLAI